MQIKFSHTNGALHFDVKAPYLFFNEAEIRAMNHPVFYRHNGEQVGLPFVFTALKLAQECAATVDASASADGVIFRVRLMDLAKNEERRETSTNQI